MSQAPLPTRKIGKDDVTAIGYGAMGIAAYYGAVDSDEERLKFLDDLYARGCTNWDTANIYGDSEELLGKWFKKTGKRNEIFLATKFGMTLDNPNKPVRADPGYAKECIEKSLNRLGVDYVDLYYIHRPDPTVPIELTMGAMKSFVEAGKVRYVGISECSAGTLRRAHAVHPIAALQVEYSVFTLDIEHKNVDLLRTARELGVTIVAYAPLGRGLLTGRYKSPDDLEEGDLRRVLPRFSKENFPNILKIVDSLNAIGAKYHATAGQVALAWLLAQGLDIIPIPGTRKLKYLDENLGALKVQLTPEDVAEVRKLAEAADVGHTVGPRYHELGNKVSYVDTPPLK
ncbi:hypothetical protein NM688_g3509 [Phlebia brevispora]|uniref:Uncharacterized protein n=1 Tax=Phlebia brevispora TaxID=194682 RepID=A0ACC1T5H6_9APHY|nr:hypothetical protein NM688_g3509 [Phlebia brevispora]